MTMKIKNHLLEGARQGHSPNQGGTINPTVIVLHYTASGGKDGKGDAEYLSRAAARASAHVVVGRDGSIDQIIPFNKKAWHAGVSSWKGRDNVNDFSIGIEIDNWGWLTNGKSHAGEVVPEEFRFTGNRSGHAQWEAYREVQLQAVEEVVKAICDNYPITDIVGHEDIAPGRKQDPGPALDKFKAHLRAIYMDDSKETETASESKSGTATPKASDGRTTTTDVRLRAYASTSATILAVISKGRKVEVLEENKKTGWSKVTVGNRTGYMASQYIS